MDKRLREEYTRLTKKEFDVKFLFIEFQDDLSYDIVSNKAWLKASPRYENNYAGECIISWNSVHNNELIMPDRILQKEDIVFKWAHLIRPILPSVGDFLLHSAAQRYGLTLNYTLVEEVDQATTDLELYVKLDDASVIESLTNQLYAFRERWNNEAEQDSIRRRGYIHWLSFERIEQEEYVFRVDIGSSGNEGFIAILDEFDNPTWQVKHIIIRGIQ
ncbi:hypothetical protein AWR27_24185 [Spirosoma montaniterrae]|uniref:Uncharacterized protein n=2 Tax=Spirosoma montaniterrae TaxID=1178516 RepID=A0A1P9X3D4_9BACT|nr:hypothetical protein AWR27_24185 [Spirosoma montaniterrae]